LTPFIPLPLKERIFMPSRTQLSRILFGWDGIATLAWLAVLSTIAVFKALG